MSDTFDREAIWQARGFVGLFSKSGVGAGDQLAAFLAHYDAMADALQQISELTPHRANASTARDLHLTVKAIADCALEAYASQKEAEK